MNPGSSTKKILLSIGVATAMFSTACAVDRDYDNNLFERDDRLVDIENVGDEEPTFGEVINEEVPTIDANEPLEEIKVDLASGLIDGDIGPNNFRYEGSELYANVGRNYSDFEFYVPRGPNSGMVIVNIFDEYDLSAMVPGQSVTLSAIGYDQATGSSVIGLACSGTDGTWEYDQPIDSVEVTVEEGPDETTNVMTLSVHHNDQVIAGAFLFSR
ncbi:MAG: hypothetical protein GY822_16855 [Deltaproteobacteria bacterium]|nr:hypothetical protein [Deltaproteobacteria bacterium]